MKLKTRIASTVMSMALALGVMTFAVYAAATQTLSVTNTVSFVSDHVLAHVTGQVEGAKAWEGGAVNWTYGTVTTNPTVNLNELDNWEIGHIDFFDENAPINIFILIENYSLERMFTFELVFNAVNNQLTSNINRDVNYFDGYNAEYDLEGYIADYDLKSADVVLQSYGNGQEQVQASTAKIIVVTLSIANTGLSVNSFNNGFTVTLLNEGTPTEQPGGGNFVYNPELQTIIIPAGQKLTDENLPNMTDEENPAFYGLYASQSFLQTERIVLPYTAEKQTTLYAKVSQTNFIFIPIANEWAVLDGDIQLTGDIELPEQYLGWPVTAVFANGFAGGEFITSVIIPPSIKYIGENAFNNCYSLSDIIFASSETPEIDKEAFNGTEWYEMQEDGLVYINGNHLYCYKGEMPENTTIILSEQTKSLGAMAFANQFGLAEIALPNTLATIGYEAFKNCVNLSQIIIPNSVTTIGKEAFYNCSGLVSATLSNALTIIKNSTFYNCTLLSEIVFSTSLRTIEPYSFYNCESLTSIEFPNSVRGVFSNAFTNCFNLQNIDFPVGISSIAGNAFLNCSKIKFFEIDEQNMYFQTVDGVLYNKSLTKLIAYPCGNESTEYIVPEYVNEIGVYAFATAHALETITVTNPHCRVSSGAFYECVSLASVALPSQLTEIEWEVFYGCTSLVEITIPSTVSFISGYAFYGSGISSVTLPEGLFEVGRLAFGRCASLSGIIVDANNQFLHYQDGLLYNHDFSQIVAAAPLAVPSNLVISDAVTIVGVEVFYGISFASVVISENIIAIEQDAFLNSSISVVYIHSLWIAEQLYDDDSQGCLIMPEHNNGGDVIYILDLIENLPDYMFDNSVFDYEGTEMISNNNYKKFVRLPGV